MDQSNRYPELNVNSRNRLTTAQIPLAVKEGPLTPWLLPQTHRLVTFPSAHCFLLRGLRSSTAAIEDIEQPR